MDFISDITQKGGEVYIVGGTNRDRYFNLIHNYNKPIIDFDLLVRCMDLDQIQSIVSKYGTCKEVGKSFGILTFKTNVEKIGIIEFDIALPRKEISTGKGYKDFEIIADPLIDIRTDLSRRDSTINAMAVRIFSIRDLTINLEDTLDENIIDPFNGKQDIQNKVWKAVGDPSHRFREDPTRIMRALRQSAELGLVLDKDTKKSIISESSLLENIMGDSAVRIVDELVRLMHGRFAHEHIKFIMTESSLWKDLGLHMKNCKRIGNFDVDTMCKIIDIYHQHLTIEQKMFILLKYTINEYTSVDKWLKKYNLSAAPHFPSKMIKFILSSMKHYSSLSSNMNDFDMRQFIIKIGDVEFARKIVDVFVCENNSFELCNIFNNNKNVILTVNDVNISGDVIANELQIEGKLIGKIKNDLFHKIVNQEIENNEISLREYLTIIKENQF